MAAKDPSLKPNDCAFSQFAAYPDCCDYLRFGVYCVSEEAQLDKKNR
jgi:hypothetical protein